MKITLKQLEELGACEDGKNWFKAQRKREVGAICRALLKDNHFDYANWLVTRLMSNPQKVQYAIYAAESVIEIFEKKHPNEHRPRKAIEASKAFLRGEIGANATANAANAADATANAAVRASAYDAYAAYATAYAAYAAVYATAYAAYATAYAAYAAADATTTTKKEIREKIIKNGLNLLGIGGTK